MPYEYSIIGGAYQSSGTFTGLNAGSLTINIRDGNLCTYSLTVTITEPPSSLTGNIVSQTDVNCFGGNSGSVTVAGTGGTAPYNLPLMEGHSRLRVCLGSHRRASYYNN